MAIVTFVILSERNSKRKHNMRILYLRDMAIVIYFILSERRAKVLKKKKKTLLIMSYLRELLRIVVF